MRFGAVMIVVGAAMLAGTPSAAHMPYVLPSVFDAGGRNSVAVEASFTEDAFRPEIAMNDAPFEITDPDGHTTKLAAPKMTRDLALAEAPLPADGIYRISSGQRLGRMGKMYRSGATWAMVGEGGAPPAGANLVDVQSTTLADAYVVRGKPGASGALAQRGTALEIHPLTDPTALTPGTPARFAVLFDGKPLAAETVTLFREAGYYDGRKQVSAVKTDVAGTVALTFADAGRYLMLVRYRPAAPSARGYLSYTTTIAVEAM